MLPRRRATGRRVRERRDRTITAGPALAALVAVAAPLSLAAPVPSPLRALLVVLALGWAPGYGVAAVPFPDPLLRTLLAIAVSLSATVAVSTTLLYLEAWTAPLTLLILCTVTLAGVVATSVGFSGARS